ncbi:YbaN family protein [Noviherbaspirillum agri]
MPVKFLLNIIGGVAVVLAILGIFLPLLPTTPFLLLASACFVRGSERLHRWLRNNPLFGEYLRNIEDKKGIPLKGKVMTLLLLWGSLGYSIHTVGPLFLKLMLAAIGIGVTTFILRMKTLRSTTQERARPER